jgi:FkbM family methyltransferase
LRLKGRVTAVADLMVSQLGCRLIPEWRLANLPQSEHLVQLFELLNIDCVLDVGANIGQYHEFLRVYMRYAGRVVSFEPVDEMYHELERQRGADPSWAIHQLALGDENTSARINVLTERTLSSLLAPNEARLREMGYEKFLRETQLERTEDVTVRRLDAIHEQVIPQGARAFLKSDTQGYDMAVIRGAAGCLERILGLQIELPIREVYAGSAPYIEALAELMDLGYSVTGFFPVQRDSTLRLINVDCVMIRDDECERLRSLGRHALGHDGRP